MRFLRVGAGGTAAGGGGRDLCGVGWSQRKIRCHFWR